MSVTSKFFHPPHGVVIITIIVIVITTPSSFKDIQSAIYYFPSIIIKTFSPLTVGVVGNSQQPGTDVREAEKATAGETTDKVAHSTSAVMGKIPESMNFEFLEMLIENILDSTSSSATRGFTLELIPDTPSAVVTFRSDQGKRPFMHQVAHEQGSLLVYVFLFTSRDL